MGESQNIPFLAHEGLQTEIKEYLQSGDMYIPRNNLMGQNGRRSPKTST